MADNNLGKQLHSAGWSQGAMLPALPWSVLYHTDDPLSKIAKTAKRQGPILVQQSSNVLTTGSASAYSNRIGVATGITRKEDYLVLASQNCDIVSNISEEPFVIALRAFITNNENILRYAGSNSSHYFLLDHNRKLVAESSMMVLIEKPVLVTFTPEPGIIDELIKQRFARWIAHRFNRPAFSDNVVGAVIKPILENLSQMQKNNDSDLDVLDMVKEVRLAKIIEKPPYEVRLLFIIPESGFPDNGIGLAQMIARMRSWFHPLAARLVAWEARHLYEISVGDYLDTEQIYLDHCSYQGQFIQGLLPPSHI